MGVDSAASLRRCKDEPEFELSGYLFDYVPRQDSSLRSWLRRTYIPVSGVDEVCEGHPGRHRGGSECGVVLGGRSPVSGGRVALRGIDREGRCGPEAHVGS
jgi:hypothetical protein